MHVSTSNPFYAARVQRVAPVRPEEPPRPVYAKLPAAPVNASPVPHLTSLYHSAEAGDYGDRNYPGNCGGNLIKDLLRYFKPFSVLDPMTGSGTCKDVCEEMGIYCYSNDLHQGADACDASQFPRRCFDFCWVHPLCGTAHNGCYVAQLVMWRPTRLLGGFQGRCCAGRHIILALQGSQELHESLIFTPRLLRFVVLDLALFKRFGFHCQINLCVQVGGTEANMAQPGSNCVDIDTGSKQMSRGCVTNCMGAHTFLCDRWQLRRHLSGVAFDQRMNSVSRDRLPPSVKEYMLRCVSTVNEREQIHNRSPPQRATTRLVSFSAQDNGRSFVIRAGNQVEIGDSHVSHFVGARSGIVQEQKDSIISAALGRALIGRLEQRIHFILFQVGDQWTRDFLRHDGLNLTAPLQMFWAVKTNESRQGMDRREPLISRGNGTVATFLDISQECSNSSRRNVLDTKLLNPTVGRAADKWQE